MNLVIKVLENSRYVCVQMLLFDPSHLSLYLWKINLSKKDNTLKITVFSDF